MKNGCKYSKIQPIPWRKRIAVPLVIGAEYFVSFEAHKVRRCRVVEIIGSSDGGRPIRVRVQQFRKSMFKYDILYIDELGNNRTSALQNCVT